MTIEVFSDADLQKFKEAQKLAYEAAEYTAGRLATGITEKEAAHLMDESLRSKGIRHFFHHSFVWFGDRTAFHNFRKPHPSFGRFPFKLSSDFIGAQLELPHFGGQFQPSERALEEGMAVILDVAPVIDDCAADIGYATSFGANKIVEQGLDDLEGFRSLILNGVVAGKTASQIYAEVDDLIDDLGYTNVHAVYPGSVLAHKVGKIPATAFPGLNIMGFDIQSLMYLGGTAVHDMVAGTSSPLWGPESDFILEPGLWAVEPHIAKQQTGVKWEEILVVTENNAYWLDDDLPHVRRWAAKKSAAK